MAQIGTFGGVVFSVSSQKILTPRDIKHTITSSWASHSIIGQKPKVEKTGNALQKITFTVVLDAQHGVKPRTSFNTLKNMCDSGTISYFIIGSTVVGSCQWRITSLTEAYDTVLSKGELSRATINITLEEYR